MQRYQHQSPAPTIDYWTVHKHEYDVLAYVKDDKNIYGFVGFSLWDNNGTLNCALYVRNDEVLLHKIENELAKLVANNNRFFYGSNHARSFKSGLAVCGYMVSTQDIHLIEIMLNYADKKLQFNSSDYTAFKSLIAMGSRTDVSQRTQVRCCALPY